MGTSPRTPDPCVSVSPGRLQPGPISTVGATWPAPTSTGNQCTRMEVPSKDVTSQSLGTPGTGVDAGTVVVGGRQVSPAEEAPVEAPATAEGPRGTDHPQASKATAPISATVARRSTNSVLVTGEVSHPVAGCASHRTGPTGTTWAGAA